MKRRGFLGLLLSAPVAARAAIEQKAVAPDIKWKHSGHELTVPAITFVNDTNTGIYSKAGCLQISVGGRAGGQSAVLRRMIAQDD